MKKSSVSVHPEPAFVFTPSDLKVLLEEREGPCVSIYFPAHRRKTESKPDAILYRNHVREVERILAEDSEPAIARPLIAKLESLDEPEFWERGSEGVAVFASTNYFRCFRLGIDFPSLEVVGGSFHTKPMLRFLQQELHYYVLALSLHSVKLYSGWGDSITEVQLQDVPLSIDEVLEEDTQRPSSDDNSAATERYFRELAKGISKKFRETRRPVILATLPQHDTIFRRAAQIPTLLGESIQGDPANLSHDSIRENAKKLLLPGIEERRARVKEDLGLALSRGQGSERIREVARAIVEGRVLHLMVESGRRIWGLLDKKTGELVPGDIHKNAFDIDLLDELAEQAIIHGGDVMILPGKEMPGDTGVAAIYRY